jgi:tagatose 1,6-diphosphate aldolase
MKEFAESLALASEAKAQFSGVLCGRATWQGGVPEYAAGGRNALSDWLNDHGVANVRCVDAALRSAVTWERKWNLR